MANNFFLQEEALFHSTPVPPFLLSPELLCKKVFEKG